MTLQPAAKEATWKLTLRKWWAAYTDCGIEQRWWNGEMLR
jgi:hypothetical protein